MSERMDLVGMPEGDSVTYSSFCLMVSDKDMGKSLTLKTYSYGE